MQGAAGEDVAVAGPVDQFDALAVGGELDQVLADDVAGTEARVARRRAGFFRRRTQRQRGAGGRIELAGMVHLDDVAVPAGQRAGGAFDPLLQPTPEARRVGKECVSTFRSRWLLYT